MSRDQPALPWNLTCAWCAFYIQVNARGQHGSDPGAGVEAAQLMQQHVDTHGKPWSEFVRVSGGTHGETDTMTTETP